MSSTQKSVRFGEREIQFEFGHIAKQAHGSILVSFGDTRVLCTVCAGKEPRPGIDFMPLPNLPDEAN